MLLNHPVAAHDSFVGELNERLFNTAAYVDYAFNPEPYHSDAFGEWNLVQCAVSEGCSNCGALGVHTDAIVVSVDGGCRKNGTDNAVGACAAYFGKYNDMYNASAMLSEQYPTNQRAELSAGLLALNIVSHIKDLNDPSRKNERAEDEAEGPESRLNQVVIKSDSQYLVRGMTDWIYSWQSNGFRNAKKKSVVNADLFKALDSKIDALNRRGVQVQFWHVPREQNTLADYLVNCRLDGVTAGEATGMLWPDEKRLYEQ